MLNMLCMHVLPIFLSSVIVLFYPMVNTKKRLILQFFTNMVEFFGFVYRKILENSIGKFLFLLDENTRILAEWALQSIFLTLQDTNQR